jgi:hypothetical protein
MNLKNKEIMFSKWHTMRWVALSIGIFLAAMAVWYQEVLTGLFSGFFLFQAITNTGCMVSQSCGIDQNENLSNNSETEPEIHFTEIK